MNKVIAKLFTAWKQLVQKIKTIQTQEATPTLDCTGLNKSEEIITFRPRNHKLKNP